MPITQDDLDRFAAENAALRASEEDLLRRLDMVAALKPGDPYPKEFDESLGPNNWGLFMSALAAEAAAKIRKLSYDLADS